MINSDLVREFISYDPETGVFTWRDRANEHFKSEAQAKNWNARYPGKVAGRIGPKGYRAIAVQDRVYSAHRLAWLYVYGSWPSGQIDHINGARDDNRIGNLRDVSATSNARNLRQSGWSASGRIGVTPYRFNKMPCWVARIRVNGKLQHLGYFHALEDAVKAREDAEKKYGFTTWPATKAPLRSRGFAKTRG